MAIDQSRRDTGKVRGRRKLRYQSFDEVLAEARRLHATPHRQLGNWTLPMILQHLANGIHGSIDGGTFNVKWYYKLIGPYVIKPMLVKGPFPAGFRLPRAAEARLVAQPDVDYDAAMTALEQAVERLKREPQRGNHPVAGKLTREEWDQFHLRHAEMHLSFLVDQ